MRIAVIIPTWNEAAAIGLLIDRLRAGRSAVPIIVADCGSSDETASIARGRGVTVVEGDGLNSRAAALAAGTQRAMSLEPVPEAMWFIHADCQPPEHWAELIGQTLTDPTVVGGAFNQRFNLSQLTRSQRARLRWVTIGNRIRYHLTGIYFGDQGIFVEAQALERVGGIPRTTLLEDAALCRALRRVGRLVLLYPRIKSNPRRFLRHGILRQMCIDGLLLITTRLGVRSPRIDRWYNREKQ